MTPLKLWPHAARADLRGVFTDIDDTLTTDGSITADALGALQDLRAAGLSVFAISGRSTGWCEGFARTWPVDAIVAENGAVALWRRMDGAVHKHYLHERQTRAAHAARLRAAAADVLTQLPHARLARDSDGRETDIAVDHSEFATLGASDIAHVVQILQRHGLTATVSSIHINGWMGEHDKLAGARWIVRERLGRALDDETQRWAFVGDSTNDACMFAHFEHSVGVANVARFWALLSHRPRYVTEGERGEGFAEVARAILAAREESRT